MSAPTRSQAMVFTPGAGSEHAFRTALGQFATGVTVVTTRTQSGPVGITVNSFASLSLDPPLVLWSPARQSSRFDIFAGATFYAIHVLAADQAPLAARFARDGTTFDLPGLRAGMGEIPLLPDVAACFECRQSAVHDGGDHVIVVGEVLRATVQVASPLVFHGGRYGEFTST